MNTSEDAAAAYAFTVARYPAERIVLWGESLDTALAITLATEKPVGCLVLEACPYRKSNADVLMLQSAEEWLGNDAANGLDRTRNRCILAQR